nr:Biomphalaria glabrata craniofacial development protein 2-like [Biomphalaria glabrata]
MGTSKRLIERAHVTSVNMSLHVYSRVPTGDCRYYCSCQCHVYLGHLAKRFNDEVTHDNKFVSSVHLVQNTPQVSVESLLGFTLCLQRGSVSTDNSDVSRDI